jgi:hypothetical protein
VILQPVFVLAPVNGYSARVAAMLGAHPDAFVVPELNLTLADNVGDLLGMFSMTEASSLADGLLRTVAQLFGQGQSMDGVEAARNWLKWRSDWSTDALFCEIAKRVAPRQLVVPDTTSPLRTDLIQRLDHQFPDAHWVHVLRHPRPYCTVTVAEMHDRLFISPDFLDHNEKFDPPILDPQLFWYRLHITLDRATKTRSGGPSSVWRLRGESLLAAPERELAQLAEWLGWRTDEDAIASMLCPQQSIFAMYGPQGARAGFDSEFLDQPEFEYRVRPFTTLDGPLEWRPDGQGFAPEIKALANRYGYA